jgi:D-alanyl-D-alanine carboxypeptidase
MEETMERKYQVQRTRILGALVVCIGLLLLPGCGGGAVEAEEVVPPLTAELPESPEAPPEPPEQPESLAESIVKETSPILLSAEASLVQDPESLVLLVNKLNHLPTDYVPPDLAYVEMQFSFSEHAEKRMMRSEAAEALAELAADATTAGLSLYGVSGYRSYETQRSIFSYNVGRFGSEQEANRISARAGESEHQTGLAMDVSTAAVGYGLEQSFDQTPEYAWLSENAHLYGFVIRYPQGKEEITGYMYEPWHIRYFGLELARELYESGLTYEEYLADA